MVLHALHLCSGYGGFELALRLAGVPARTVAHVERDAYAAATLVARMEEAHLDPAPIWSDLTTFDGAAWRGRVDLITAGFPCQPFSSAGQQRGVDDDRWLWPAIGRLVRDVGPRLVFLENVPGLVRAGLPHVLADLAEMGFDAEWGLLSAAAVGAPHQRERFWLLAHADRDGLGAQRRIEPVVRDVDRRSGATVADTAGVDEREPHRSERTLPRERSRGDTGRGSRDVVDAEGAQFEGHRGALRVAWPPGRDDDGWREWVAQGGPEPSLRRVADGPPLGLADALHLGGNGLVPAVAARALVELAGRLGVDLWGL